MAYGSSLPQRLVKLAISIVFYAAMQSRRVILRVLGKKIAPTCSILYYHAIPDSYRTAFARQMDLLRNLAVPIECEDMPDMLPGMNYSAVTFDDGFENAVRNAVPELARREIPAVFFITVDVLGKPASWWPDGDPESVQRLATPRELQSLPENIRVAAHTLTHPRLSRLSRSDAMREIGEPRQKLEAMMGYPIKSLSFPYGDFNEDVSLLAREAGYKVAFTTVHTNAFNDRNEFLVGRIKADPWDWEMEFKLKVVGGYTWLPAAIAMKRRILRGRRAPSE